MSFRKTLCSDYFLTIYTAETFFQRFKGLMLKKKLWEHEALHIRKCNSVHTFWMRFSIDLIYLDDEYRIIRMDENVKPWNTSKCAEASSVLEAASGICLKYKFQLNQKLLNAIKKEI